MASILANRMTQHLLDLTGHIPEEQWVRWLPVIEAAEARRLPLALGGGLAYSACVRRWRNTKDLDLYVLPAHRREIVELTVAAGFSDYYGQLPYDRSWIYRGYRDTVIIDVIWQMANHRAEVVDDWVTRGPQVEVRGVTLRLLPIEYLIWSKLYFNTAEQLAELLDPLPELALHLDIGHANLMAKRNTTEAILARHGHRLRHVHLHDNRGGDADLHLPLGTGNLDLPRQVRALKSAGYDDTITLEVFSPDRHFLLYSRNLLEEVWAECEINAKVQPA